MRSMIGAAAVVVAMAAMTSVARAEVAVVTIGDGGVIDGVILDAHGRALSGQVRVVGDAVVVVVGGSHIHVAGLPAGRYRVEADGRIDLSGPPLRPSFAPLVLDDDLRFASCRHCCVLPVPGRTFDAVLSSLPTPSLSAREPIAPRRRSRKASSSTHVRWRGRS